MRQGDHPPSRTGTPPPGRTRGRGGGRAGCPIRSDFTARESCCVAVIPSRLRDRVGGRRRGRPAARGPHPRAGGGPCATGRRHVRRDATATPGATKSYFEIPKNDLHSGVHAPPLGTADPYSASQHMQDIGSRSGSRSTLACLQGMNVTLHELALCTRARS